MKIQLRSIKTEAIANAIEKPEQEFEDLERHAKVAVTTTGTRHLIVAYSKQRDAITVITVYSTSKLDKLIASKERRGAWRRTK